jgi:hypothetical protein
MGHEADHSHPSNAEINNAWSYTSPPPYASMVWCSVKKKAGGKCERLKEERLNYTTFILDYTIHCC